MYPKICPKPIFTFFFFFFAYFSLKFLGSFHLNFNPILRSYFLGIPKYGPFIFLVKSLPPISKPQEAPLSHTCPIFYFLFFIPFVHSLLISIIAHSQPLIKILRYFNTFGNDIFNLPFVNYHALYILKVFIYTKS